MDLAIGNQLMQYLPVIGIVVFMILMTVLPQRKRSKEVKKMMDEMKRGDWVTTIGGLTGRVTAIKDDLVTIETGPQHVQVTYTRGAIKSVGDAQVEADGLSETDINVATKSEKKK
jgi:preprotein translocase subunit YajC